MVAWAVADADPGLTIGDDVELELDRRQLLRDDEWFHLRPKEAKLLQRSGRSPGRVLTRDQLLERVWAPNHGGDRRAVDVHVRWLRSKIEPDPHVPVWLLTVAAWTTGWRPRR